MTINKKKHKFLISFLTIILIGSSLTSGYFIYNNVKIKPTIKSVDEKIASENNNPIITKNLLENAIRSDLTGEIINLNSLIKAINYTEKFGYISYIIDDELLQPALKETVQKAIVKKQKNLIPIDQFNGKIFYNINNINMSVNVIITWENNQYIEKKYYDHFQINFLF